MNKKFNVAVVGATGIVGEVILEILQERKFPINMMHAIASHRSAGHRVSFNNKMIVVQDLEDFDFSDVDIALFSPGATVSRKYVPKATEAGCVVIDNTSEFRYDDDVPLVIPEINPAAIAMYKNRGIIANPNCSTIQMLMVLKPIHDVAYIERINVCTYQSVSGKGKAAMEELVAQTTALLSGESIVCDVFPKQIAFNALPQIDDFQDNGYTKEEMKMVWETRKIFSDNDIQVNATAVRLPIFFGHSEAINIETRKKISVEKVKNILKKTAGIKLLNKPIDGGYPTAVSEATNHDDVFVGRIREDISHPRGMNFWVVADNIRKGAALNSVQIAEILVKNYL